MGNTGLFALCQSGSSVVVLMCCCINVWKEASHLQMAFLHSCVHIQGIFKPSSVYYEWRCPQVSHNYSAIYIKRLQILINTKKSTRNKQVHHSVLWTGTVSFYSNSWFIAPLPLEVTLAPANQIISLQVWVVGCTIPLTLLPHGGNPSEQAAHKQRPFLSKLLISSKYWKCYYATAIFHTERKWAL